MGVFTFLKARGLDVGNSLVEEDFLDLAKSLEEKAKAKGVELILPEDVACGDGFPADGKEVGFKVVKASEIPDGWLGLTTGRRQQIPSRRHWPTARPSSGTAPWACSKAPNLLAEPTTLPSALQSSLRRAARPRSSVVVTLWRP